MRLVFASANQNKVKEIQNLLPSSIKILSLNDINCVEEIPETQATIEGNATQKAFYIFKNYNVNCFADDTGLEIEALENRPGVLSARYAGEAKDANANMDKVLAELKGIENRKARFKTIISLVIDGKEKIFEGVVNGLILEEKRGSGGFGYDPIFAPTPFSYFPKESFGQGERQELRSFAEMTLSEKNKISHRAIAVNKLVQYLKIL